MKDIVIGQGYEPIRSEEAPFSTSRGQKSESFGDILKNSFEEVNALQDEADKAIRELASGQSKNLHETMILLEKAEISFRLMMQVRNKILDAYQEIMRMPV